MRYHVMVILAPAPSRAASLVSLEIETCGTLRVSADRLLELVRGGQAFAVISRDTDFALALGSRTIFLDSLFVNECVPGIFGFLKVYCS